MLKRKSGRQLYDRGAKPSFDVLDVDMSDSALLAEISRQFSVDEDLKDLRTSVRHVIGLLQRKGLGLASSDKMDHCLFSAPFLKQLQPFVYWLLHLSGTCAFSDYLQHLYSSNDKTAYLAFIDTLKGMFYVTPGNDERQRIMYDLYTDIIRYVFLMSVYGTTSNSNTGNKGDVTAMSTYMDFAVPVNNNGSSVTNIEKEVNVEEDVVFVAQLDENALNNTLSTATGVESFNKNDNTSNNTNVVDKRAQELHHHVLRDIVRPAGGGAVLSSRDVACYGNVLRLCALWTAPGQETLSLSAQHSNSLPFSYAPAGDGGQNQPGYRDKASLVLQNLEVSSLCHILASIVDANADNGTSATRAEVEDLLQQARSTVKHTVFNRILSPQVHFIDENSDFAFIMNECRHSTRGHSVLFYVLANLLESSDGEGEYRGRDLITTHSSSSNMDSGDSQLFACLQLCATACEQEVAGLYHSGITRTISIALLLTRVYSDRCMLRDAGTSSNNMVDIPAKTDICFDNWLMRLLRIVVTAEHEAFSVHTLSSYSTGWNNVQVVPSKEYSSLLFALSPLVPYLPEASVRLLQKVGKRIKQNLLVVSTHSNLQQSTTAGNSSNSSMSLHTSCKAACDALLNSCKKKMVQIEKARDPLKFLTYMHTFRSKEPSASSSTSNGNGDGDSSSSMLTEANLATLSQYIPVWASTYKTLGSLPAQVAAQCRMYGAGRGHRILMDAMTQCIGRSTGSNSNAAMETDGDEVPSKVTTAMVYDVVVGMTRCGPNGAPLCPQDEGHLFLSTLGPRAKGSKADTTTGQATTNGGGNSHVSHSVRTLLDHLPLRPLVKTCLGRSLVVMRQAIQLVSKGYTIGRHEVQPQATKSTLSLIANTASSGRSQLPVPVEGGVGSLGPLGTLNVGGSHDNLLAAEMLPVWEEGIAQALAMVQEAQEHASSNNGGEGSTELVGISSVVSSSLAQLAREITGAISIRSSGTTASDQSGTASDGGIDGAFCKHWLFFLSQALRPLSAHPLLQTALFEALFPVAVRDNASNSNSNVNRCAMTQTGGLVLMVMGGEMCRKMVERLLSGNTGTNNTGRDGGAYLSLLRQMTCHDVLQSGLLWTSTLYSFTASTVITDSDRRLVLDQRLQQCPAYLSLLADYLTLHMIVSQYGRGQGAEVHFVDICGGYGHEDVVLDVANMHTISTSNDSNSDRWLNLLQKPTLQRALTLMIPSNDDSSGTLRVERGDRRLLLQEIMRLQHALEPIVETAEKEAENFLLALYRHAAVVLPSSTGSRHARAGNMPAAPQSLSGAISRLYRDLQPHKASTDPSNDDFGAGKDTSASDRALECVENRLGEVVGSLYGEVPAYCVSVTGRVNLSAKPPAVTSSDTRSNASFSHFGRLHANRLLVSLLRAHRYIAPDVLLDMWAVLGDGDMGLIEDQTAPSTTRELLKDVYMSVLSVNGGNKSEFSLQGLAALLDSITAQMWCKGEREAAFAFVRGMALLESVRDYCIEGDIAAEAHRGMMWLVGVRPNIASMCGYPPSALPSLPMLVGEIKRAESSILLIADVALISHQVMLFDIITTTVASNSGDKGGWTATSLDASHTYLTHLLRTPSPTIIPRAALVAFVCMTLVHAILYDISIYERAFHSAVPVFKGDAKEGGRAKRSGLGREEAISIDMSQSDSTGSKYSNASNGNSNQAAIDLDAEESVVNTHALLQCWLHGLRLWLPSHSVAEREGGEGPLLLQQVHDIVSDALWSLPAALVGMRLSMEQVNAIVNYVTSDGFRELYAGLEEMQYAYVHPFNATLDRFVDGDVDSSNNTIGNHCQALLSLLAGCLLYSASSLDTRKVRGASSPLSKRRKGSGSNREVLRNERQAAAVMKTHVYMALQKYSDHGKEEGSVGGRISQHLRYRGLPSGVVQQCIENL